MFELDILKKKMLTCVIYKNVIETLTFLNFKIRGVDEFLSGFKKIYVHF